MKLLMIFNENFVVGERYRADTGERFRVVDVESTSDAWFSIGKKIGRLSFALDIFQSLCISWTANFLKGLKILKRRIIK